MSKTTITSILVADCKLKLTEILAPPYAIIKAGNKVTKIKIDLQKKQAVSLFIFNLRAASRYFASPKYHIKKAIILGKKIKKNETISTHISDTLR